MAARIVSFSRKMITRNNLANEPLFIKAVDKAAMILEGDDSDKVVQRKSELTNKRQAAKFFQGKGLVYTTITEKEG